MGSFWQSDAVDAFCSRYLDSYSVTRLSDTARSVLHARGFPLSCDEVFYGLQRMLEELFAWRAPSVLRVIFVTGGMDPEMRRRVAAGGLVRWAGWDGVCMDLCRWARWAAGLALRKGSKVLELSRCENSIFLDRDQVGVAASWLLRALT